MFCDKEQVIMRGDDEQRPRELNDVMEFDHVIESHGDGTVTWRSDLYAPEVLDEYIERDGFSTRGMQKWKFTGDPEWELLYGHTGQDSYNGPVMHESEFVGGGLAHRIIETPGVYVVVAVYTLEPQEGCEFCEEETANEGHPCPCDQHNIVGWAVAKRCV